MVSVGVFMSLCAIVVLIASFSNDMAIAFAIEDDLTPLESINSDISEQNKIVKSIADNISKMEMELSIVEKKALKSWNLIPEIDEINDEIESAKSDLKTEQQKLKSLESKRESIENENKRIENTKRVTENKEHLSQLTKLIGVELSKSCIIMIQNNLDTTCPNYEILSQLDSSNTEFTGEFTVDEETGFFHRGTTEYENSHRWYDYDDSIRVIVDPPADMRKHIKMITIEDNFGIYFTVHDMDVKENVRTYHQERYIESCRYASISSENWKDTIADTIYTMRNNCSDTGIDELVQVQMDVTEFDITTSRQWQFNEWLNETKENCKLLCKEY